MPKAVILDVDGTLVDSNEAHAQSWHQSFKEHGLIVPIERIRKLVGMGGDHLLRAAAEVDHESHIGKSIGKRRGEIFTQQHLPHLRPFPRARDLVQHMKAQGLTLAVGSSGVPAEIDALLSLVGVLELITARTSAEDAERSKPSPDIIQAAFGKLHFKPSEVLTLGDTPYDVKAAQKAGVGCVAVRTGGWSAEELVGAIAIYDGCADLLHRYDESPFAS